MLIGLADCVSQNKIFLSTAAGACRRSAARNTTILENRQKPRHISDTCRCTRFAIYSIRTPKVSPDYERNAASANLTAFCHLYTRNGNAQSNIALTNTPREDANKTLPTLDKAELSDIKTFVTRRWQFMQRVSREIVVDEPNDMDDQAEDPTVALIAPP